MTMRMVVVCTALATLLSCNRNLDIPPLPETATVSASIDTDSHLPAENNTLRLIESSSGARFDQQTNTDGKAVFAGLRPGQYLLQADVPGFAPLREGPFVVASGENDLGLFKLVWLGQTEQEGSISGAVVVAGGSAGMLDGGSPDDGGIDAGSLLPDGGMSRPSDAMGATVSMLLERPPPAMPAKVAEVTVDAFGRFSARVPPGRYTIEATHPWYVSAKRDGVLLGEGQLLDLGQPLVLQLNPADVSGQVELEVEIAGAISWRAGDGVTVTSDTGFTTTTDLTGRYTLPGLAAGTRRLTFTRGGFHDGTPVRTINLAAGEHATYERVRLLLDRGDLKGTVRMSDGSQLADVTVAIAGTPDGGSGGYPTQAVRSATDQSVGDFTMRGVPVGTYTLVARRTNYVEANSPAVQVQVNQTTPVPELRLARLQGDFLIEDTDPLNTAGFTRERNVTLVLSNVSNAAEFRAVEGTQQDLMAAMWQPYSLPRIPFTLSSGDAPKTIYLQIKNTMGNEGPALSATIVLDTTPPNSGSILLSSGQAFTRIANPLPVTLSALDVGGVAFVRMASVEDGGVEYEDAGVPIPDGGFPNLLAPRVAYVRDTSFQRPTSVDAIQTVAAQFIDNAGNSSDVVLATIVIDTVPPTGSLSVVRGARASLDGYTNTLLVELAETWGMEPNGGFVQVRLANDAVDLSNAVAQPTRARASWFLDAQGEGTKTVHYLFVDAAGNQGGAAQATIIYDATSPLVTANLTSGSPTSNPQVNISLNTVETSPFSPDAGVSVSESAIFSNAIVGPYPSNNQVQFTLSSGDGPRNVFIRVRDAAGNDGTASVGLELDTTPPTGLGIALVGALDDGTPSSSLTSDPVVTVNLTHSGATRVLLGDDTLTTCPAVSMGMWRAITGTSIANHPLPGSGATRTVSACYADGAGNVAGPVSATINFDGAAPTGCQLALTGLRTDGQPSGSARTALRSVPYTLTNCTETPLEIALTEQTTVTCTATTAGLVWSPYSATANQFTLSSVDGAKNVRGCVRDAARNTTSFVLGALTLDTSPPTNARVTINGGTAYINASAVDAGVALATVTGTALDATEWAFSEEGTTPSNFVSYTMANPGTLALSAGDGVKTVKALFRDDLGNTIAAEVADSIEVDTTPPVLTSLSLLGTLADGTSNTALTAVPDVTASLVQTGASTVFFGGSALSVCPTTGHQQLVGNTAIVTLSGSGLTRTVKACVGDAAGNISTIRTATIDFDNAAPSSCALQLTGLRADDATPTSGVAAGLSGRRDVRFTLNTCTETPTQIALTQSAVSCAVNANLVWTPYDALATNSFTLAGVDGAKTVFGCVRDAARNTGGLVAASITLDTTAPSGTSVSLDTGAAYVNAAQKIARGNVNRASAQGTVTGGYEWALAEGTTPSTWRVLSSNNPFNFDFSAGDGVKTVRVLFRDEVGNVTPNEVTDSIEFDTVAPTLTSVSITGQLADGSPSSASTSSANVTATVLHSGGTSIAFGSTAGLNCTTASYSSFSGTTVSTTLGGSGTPRTLAVCIQDPAGNPAGPVSNTIVFDSAGPTGCTLVMSGRKADGSATALDATALRDVPFTLSGCVETGTVTEISLTEAATINCAGNLTWRTITGGDILTLSEVDGVKTVRGCVRDQSRNVGSLTADSITLDTTPPTAASVSIEAGAAYFNRADYLGASPGSTNTMSVTGSATDAVDWALSESATPSSFGPLVANNFTFSTGDGVKSISALFRDALGNVTPVSVTDTITVDTVVPQLTAINLSGNLADGTDSDVTTTTSSVQLSLTHVDGVGLFVGDGALAACPTTGYVSFGGGSSATINLPGSGSPRTVRICVADVAGNTAGFLQDSIGFDSNAPTSCALTLVGRRTNGVATSGATVNKTALTAVGISLASCSETPADIYLVEAGSVGCSATASLAWQPYVAGATNFTLTGGDASKTVVGCVRDAARNVSGITLDDITLDTTPPTLASVTLFAGAQYFNRANWLAAPTPNTNTMNLNATVTGASEWAFAENATPTSFNAASFPVNQNVTLSVGDGVKTIRALFRDDVGNTTPAEVSDTIDIDTLVPTLTSITITGTLADGSASSSSTSSTAVNVTLAQSGATLVALGDSTFVCPAAPGSFTSFNGISANTTLTDSSANRTVGACVADAAGNISATRTSSILYDAAAPTGCVLTLVGRRTDGSSTAGTAPEKTANVSVTAALSSCSEVPSDIYLVETSGAVSCPAAGSAVWQTLSGGTSLGFSLSTTDALKTVKACVRDATRNVSAASFTDTITLDTTPPTGASVQLHSGADYFNRNAWLGQGSINRMGVTGTAAGATEWAFSETGTPTAFNSFTSPTTTQNTFTNGEGTRKVYALFRDDVGNTTFEVSDGIEVDVTLPTLTSLTLVGTLGDGTTSAAISNTTSVTGNVVQSGATAIASGDGTFTCPGGTVFTTFNGSSVSLTLPGSGTTRTMRVCVADAAGNSSGVVQDSIDFDGAAPSGCALVMTGRRVDGVNTTGAQVDLTALRDVGVSLSGCADTNVEVALTEAASITCSNTAGLTWTSLSAASTFQVSAGDGSKTVRGCVRDAALNVGSLATDAITLDTTPPDNATVKLNGAGGYANSFSRIATGTADNATEWAVAIASTGPFTFSTYTGPSSTLPANFSLPDGTKTVYARFRDGLLNTTNTVSDNIVVDTTPPSIPVLLTVDSQNRGARMFWDPSNDATSGVAAYELLADPPATPVTVRATTGGGATSGYVLGLENRTDNVFAVRAVDFAGNRSMPSAVMGTTVGWRRLTVTPNTIYPIRPLDIAMRGPHVFVSYMETDSNWTGIVGNLKMAVSHDRGETWSFKTLDNGFYANRQIGQIRFTDEAIWVGSAANPGWTSDMVAGNVALHTSQDNGETWQNVSDSDLGTPDNYAKVDSMSLVTSGSSMRAWYISANANNTKRMSIVSSSSPNSSTWQSAAYSSVFGSAPYQVTNGLRSCAGNFSSVHVWRDRSDPATNAPNLLALTHYFLPDVDYGGGEGSAAFITSGMGNGMEAGNLDMACVSLSETMQAYLVYDRAPAAAWAVGANGVVLKYDDTAWVTAASPTPRTINSVQDVWALGNGYSAGGTNYSLIMRWNGMMWEELQSTVAGGASLYDSYTAASNNVFAVGSGGVVIRWDGTSWASMTSATGASLNGVWGSSGTNVFAVGTGGVIQRYVASWATMTSPTANTLRAVWGSASNNIWAVGDNGTIIRNTGGAWFSVASPTSANLQSIWGSGPSDIWAVGSGGTIIRYNGSSWSVFASPTLNQLQEVSGISANDVWAVGIGGTVIHYTGGASWTAVPSETTGTLNSVWWGGSSGGLAGNLWAKRKLGSLQSFTAGVALRSDVDRTMSPKVWAGGRNVYVLYRTTTDRLMLGESTDEGTNFTNWTTLETGANKGLYASLTGDNSSDVAVAFTDINANTMTVMIPQVPSFALTPIAGVGTSSLTWSSVPGVDRYQVDSDPDGALPWANIDFTSQTQATVPNPSPAVQAPYVQVRPVDERGMPGNSGEIWQVRPFNDSTLVNVNNSALGSSNTGGIVAYNDKALVWPPLQMSNGLQVWRTSNYGQTWTSYTPTGTVSASGPRAIAGFNGRAFMFYQDGSATTTLRVQSFSEIGAGTATLGTLQAGVGLSFISAKTSIDNSGLVVAYADAATDIIRVATADASGLFTIRTSIPTTAANTIGTIEVAKVDFSTNRVVIAWREYNGSNPRTDTIVMAESVDRGVSWGPNTVLQTGTWSATLAANFDIGNTDLSGSNNGAYSVLARTSEFNDFYHEPANLWLTVTGTDHSTTVSGSTYVQVKLDSETVDQRAFDAFGNSDGHYVAWRSETLDGTVSKLRFAYCFADCHLFSRWDRSVLKVWTTYVRDQGRFVDMTISQNTPGFDPAIYVLYTEAANMGLYRDVKILSRGVHRRTR